MHESPRPPFQFRLRDLLAAMFWAGAAIATWRVGLHTRPGLNIVVFGLACAWAGAAVGTFFGKARKLACFALLAWFGFIFYLWVSPP